MQSMASMEPFETMLKKDDMHVTDIDLDFIAKSNTVKDLKQILKLLEPEVTISPTRAINQCATCMASYPLTYPCVIC